MTDNLMKINDRINNAKRVFVCVAGTEFWLEVSKTEALALNRYANGNLNLDDRPHGLYLDA